MTHRAETILEAVKTTLTGLATTGARIERGRVWPVDTLPALTVAKGVDQVSEDENILPTVIRELTVNIIIHVQQTGNPETPLHVSAAEVFAALKADTTLGLAYVFDCDLIADQEPEIEDTQDIPIARMVSEWRILYEHSEASAEA